MTLPRQTTLIALGILLACCPFAFALDSSLDVNQYAHTAWTIREGFSKGEIISIAQTPDGYIWLGTRFGLLRFDGVKTIQWQPTAGQRLQSNQIFSLLAARDGTLWIGTGKGLASWKDGKLKLYGELGGHYIFKILEDHEGTIWASGLTVTVGKLCAIRDSGVQCYGEDGTLGRGAYSLYEDSKGNLWAGVKDGLWRWRPRSPKFYPLAGERDGIRALSEDADGTLLVGWHGGLCRFVDGKTEPYRLPGITQQFSALGMLRDHEGALWLGTRNGGLLHVHKERTDVLAQGNGLSGDTVNAFFEDSEGSIWVATVNGLDRFREFAIATLTPKEGLSNGVVEAVLADRDGSVWLSTRGGLNRWSHGQIESYRLGVGKRSDHPESLFQDDRGRIWVSTVRGIGYLQNDRFIPISGVAGGNTLSISQDTAGNLWIDNEQSGLFRLSARGEVQQFPWSKLGHQDHASVLAAGPAQGGLWIGFFLGGIVYLKDGQIQRSYSAGDGLGDGRVSGFLFDQDGTLWISTEGGLSRLKDNHVATLTSKNGLPCDTVHWAMEDDDHSVWLYMPCGLVRVNRSELDAWATDAKRTIQVTLFDSFDGVRSLAGASHYSPLVAKSGDGKLWFTPTDGVSVIDPHRLAFNKLPPPVHIEQITADGKTHDLTLGASGRIPLPPLARELEIDYTALTFVVPEKVRFRYKLEGFDREWQEAGTRRQAFYTNLPPRNYRFRVAACNNSGVWNEAGATLDFSIAPAYYQATWFRVLCIVFSLAFLWWVYKLRRRQLLQQFNMRLETRVNERTRIARELHDTLLQSFHGLLFRFQAARNMLPGRPQEAGQALDGAITRAEQAIAEGRSAIQDLRSTAGAQGDLAQSLRTIGRELATQNGDHDSPAFHVVVEGERRTLSPLFQDEVYRMGRELLLNAFAHARAHEIEAEIRYDHRTFYLLIRDDGRGIDSKVLEQGGRPGHWGLAGVRERAQQIGAQLDFWSEAGAGTEIQLTVPANIAYEKSQDGSGFWRWGRRGQVTGHR